MFFKLKGSESDHNASFVKESANITNVKKY
jgi:hypothetical protein